MGEVMEMGNRSFHTLLCLKRIEMDNRDAQSKESSELMEDEIMGG